MRKLSAARRLSQTFFLLLFIYILWSTTYPLRGLFPSDTFFRTNPLIIIFTSISERLVLPGIVFAALMLLLTFVLGRFYCGWVCPLGAVIDLGGSVRKKKSALGVRAKTVLRSIKFVILTVIAAAAVFGNQLAWVLDPMGIMARFVSLNLIPTVTLAMDKIFIFLIRDVGLYGPVHDFYRALKGSVLGVRVHYFSNSVMIFLFFAFVIAGAFFMSRFWCRTLCPLGALYALVARFSLLERIVKRCTGCYTCVGRCRTGAITNGLDYVKGECVLCMDCVYDCPEHATEFRFRLPGSGSVADVEDTSGKGISRKNFLFLMGASLALLGANKKKNDAASRVIRPPAALKEKEFVDRCVRCGNCMKVCPTNGLQPAMLETGLTGIWTPHLVPEIGYCEYKCVLCGNVCPTGAITKVSPEKKLDVKLGTAKVDRTKCIAWAYGQECVVCEEHCPVSEKAIKIVEEVMHGRLVKKPVVDPELCVGCGICQNKCPVRPVRAIRVLPEGADRY